ncbi:MAG: transposase domain-containing protein [Verrucomicrobiales bacterium]
MLRPLKRVPSAQGVDPQAYLRDLIERLPTTTTSGSKALTPANWAAAHKAKSQQQNRAPVPKELQVSHDTRPVELS